MSMSTAVACEPRAARGRHVLVHRRPRSPGKLDAYLQFDSLQEYWIASPSRILITQYVRQDDEWVVRSVRNREAVLRCEALDIELAMDDIYALVETEEAEDAPAASGDSNDEA
jgi:hypothetical protein